MGFTCSSADKESPCNVGDLGSIPGLERSGEGKGPPLQYSDLDNPPGYSLWGCKELDTTEQLSLSFFVFAIMTHLWVNLSSSQCYPTPVLLPGKSHGRRSLVGCIPWGRKESDRSDFTFTFHFNALEKEKATHSSVLAWRIPGMGLHRVGHSWSDLAVASSNQGVFGVLLYL